MTNASDSARPKAAMAPRGQNKQPHHDADPAADRDVLDPGEADLPAGGLNDVEEDDHHQGERGLAGGKRDHGGRDARYQDGQGQQHPQRHGMAPHPDA